MEFDVETSMSFAVEEGNKIWAEISRFVLLGWGSILDHSSYGWVQVLRPVFLDLVRLLLPLVFLQADPVHLLTDFIVPVGGLN